LLLGIGTGKTYTALIISQLWNRKKTLVVCPASVRTTWKAEIEKHSDYTYTELAGTANERKKLLKNSKTDYYIINYEGLNWLFGKKVEIPGVTKKTGKSKTKFVMDLEAVNEAGFDCLIIDEVHHCRNWNASQTKLCYEISNRAKHCITLTGTPFSKDMTDFWSEFMVMDYGATFGKSYWTFLNKWFNSKQIQVKSNVYINLYSIKKEKKDEFLNIVADKTLRYETSECVDLPEIIREKREVIISAEQVKIYDDILLKLKAELADGLITVRNIQNKSAKLTQLLSGFILSQDSVFVLKTNPKLDELIDVLYETTEKCVVFHHYEAEGRLIEKRLKKEKIPYASLRGEIKNKEGQIKKFKTDPNCKVLVAHPQSGGEGLNLQEASVCIFYSQIGGGGISRPQAEGRIRRQGQNSTCVVVDLVAVFPSGRETVDGRLYQASSANQSFAETVLKFLAE